MYFFKRGGWQVQFLEADLKTPLPRKLTFADPDKIRNSRSDGTVTLENRDREMSIRVFVAGRN
jgi:hypothetical protein